MERSLLSVTFLSHMLLGYLLGWPHQWLRWTTQETFILCDRNWVSGGAITWRNVDVFSMVV
jgi:multisubunit Na+/H+ antiporter MnhB subunit